MTKYKYILPTKAELLAEEIAARKFRILDKSGENILWKDVSLNNAVFVGLQEIIQYGCDNLKIKSLEELQVNESVECRFSMSMTTGIYKVLRVA